MAELFGIAVAIVIVGWLWFIVARPILEDFGIIRIDDEPETVNSSQVVMSPAPEPKPADRQTDTTDRPSVSADDLRVERLQLDRTKTAIIEVMVYNGWQVGEIRAVLKGDNGALGTEVEAARKRLNIDPPERLVRVRDAAGERVITL